MGRQGRLFSDAGQHLIVGSRSIEHEVILARRIYQQDQLHVIFLNKRVFINDHLTLMWRWRIFKDIMRHYELIYMHLFFIVRHHACDRHAIDTVHVRPRLWNQLLCAVPEISFEVLRNQLLWGIQMAYHSSPNHHSEKNAQSIRKWTPQWRAYESITLLAHRPFFLAFLVFLPPS